MKNKITSSAFGLSLLFALAACGGGGTDPAPVVLTPDLSVTSAVTTPQIASGESTTFSTSVTNQGTADATAVELRLTLPSSLSLASIQCAATGGAVCPTSLGSTMTVANLPVNGRLNFSANVTGTVGANGPSSWTWAATNAQDTTLTNNSVAATQNVYSHNLSITSTAPIGLIAAGAVAEFEIKVSNAGPSTATDANLTITPDSALTVASMTCAASATATCPTNLNGTINIAQLATGAELTFRVTTNTLAGTNGPAVLSSQIAAKGDSNSANNSNTSSATVYSANLSASLARLTTAEAQTAGLTATDAGELTYRATINNAGPGDARSISVTLQQDTTSTTWVSCSATGGAVCPSLTATPLVIPTIVSGGTLTLVGKTNAPLTDSGTATAQLSVSAAGDPSSANNASTVTTVADTRNGSYTAYGFNGERYTLELNLNSGAWLIKNSTTLVASGYARDVNGNFDLTAESTSAPSGIAKGFRIANGLLVAKFPLGAANGPTTGLVASKSFTGTLSDLTGELNFFSSTISSVNGSTESSITTGEFRNSGTQLVQCVDTSIWQPSQCPPASLRTYTVTANGLDLTLTNVSTPTDVVAFRVVKVNNALIYLRVGTLSNLDKRFTIGMSTNASFPSSTITLSTSNVTSLRAGSITSTTVQSATQLPAANDDYQATLVALSGGSPASLRSTSSLTGNGTFGTYTGQGMFVMQGPLYAAIGLRSGGLAGRIEVGLFQ